MINFALILRFVSRICSEVDLCMTFVCLVAGASYKNLLQTYKYK